MVKKPKPIVRGRDAEDGKFIPISEAKRRPKEAIVDRMPRKPKKKK
jgi:hypothetical protein